MWLLPPFLERQTDNECSLEFALTYYFSQIKLVLESFDLGLDDFQLKDDVKEFIRCVKSGFLLEFFNVVIINPIKKMRNPAALRKWRRKVQRHSESIKDGRNPRQPSEPQEDDIVQSEQFGKFANLYCKVAHILGVFSQVGAINLEIVRENMFRDDEDEKDKDEEDESNDIYPDEEEPLSDEEYDQSEAAAADPIDQSQKGPEQPSFVSRVIAWVLNICGFCRKKQ